MGYQDISPRRNEIPFRGSVSETSSVNKSDERHAIFLGEEHPYPS
jgi:hypothetical protein